MKHARLLKLVHGLLSSGHLADHLPRSRRADAEELNGLARAWLGHGGIQGFGIARRVTAGIPLKERVLKVYVERKLPRQALGSALIPKEITLPSLGISVPVDVEAIGQIRAQNYQRFQRPLFRGLSIGMRDGQGGGTLGCFIRKRGNDPAIYLLSNAHVLHLPGNSGDEVFQPAPDFGGLDQDHIIGDFTEAAPITYGEDRFVNRVDAAIARVRPGVGLTPTLTAGATGVIREGTEVILMGATSGGTMGRIKDASFDVAVTYANPYRTAGFRDQVLCTPFSSEGDSGSIVLNRKNQKVLGLLIAGGPGGSVFTPIKYVMEELGINIILSDQDELPTTAPDTAPARFSGRVLGWEKALEKADTGGCSPRTHAPGGVDASRELAGDDLKRAERLKDRFRLVGREFHIPPSVLAAIASRESRMGMEGLLDENGFGDHGNAFGILQVDRRYHQLKGLPDPGSLAHIRQAVAIFAGCLDKIAQAHPDWGQSDILKGGMVAYNAGLKTVRTIEEMDRGTTHNDYGSDVTARAQFFLEAQI